MSSKKFEDNDLLELFNYVEFDDKEENLEFEMDDLRKKALKKRIMKQVKNESRHKKFSYKTAAAAIVIGLVFITANVSIFAQNIPGLKSIIQYIYGSKNDNTKYERYSQAINESITDNGVTFTINDALCDGSSLMIGYTIKSQGDIRKFVLTGDKIIEKQAKDSSFVPFFIKAKINGQETASGSSYGGRYKDEHTYVNSEILDLGDKDLPDKIKVDININDIYGIKGRWDFRFIVSKKRMSKDIVDYKPNDRIKMPDAYLNIERVRFTPIATYMTISGKYIKEEYKNPDKRKEAFNEDVIMGNTLYDSYFVLDDSGNEIELRGSSGHAVEKSNTMDFEDVYRFENIKHIPKYITVIPYKMNYSKTETETKAVYVNINGKYPMELRQGNMGKITVDSIEYKKDRTIVTCTAEGKAPFLQANEIYIMDDKNNQVGRKDMNYKVKRDTVDPRKYILEFDPMSKNKKYKIGTNDLSSYDVRNDLKFKIQLHNK